VETPWRILLFAKPDFRLRARKHRAQAIPIREKAML
jgi:hypothetical protein